MNPSRVLAAGVVICCVEVEFHVLCSNKRFVIAGLTRNLLSL